MEEEEEGDEEEEEEEAVVSVLDAPFFLSFEPLGVVGVEEEGVDDVVMVFDDLFPSGEIV